MNKKDKDVFLKCAREVLSIYYNWLVDNDNSSGINGDEVLAQEKLIESLASGFGLEREYYGVRLEESRKVDLHFK